MSRRSLPFALTAGLAVVSCGGDAAPSRAETVAAMTEAEVPARWQVFADRAVQLRASAGDLCDGSSGPAAVLDDTVAVRSAWTELNPWWFGPVMDRRSRFVVDFDISPDEIDELLASDQAVDATSLRELFGADQRGLGAIDHVLTDVDAIDGRPCEFVVANAALVEGEAAALAAAWESFGPTTGADDEAANAAIESMVNESLFALAALRDEVDSAVIDSTLRGIRWAMVGDVPADGDAGADGDGGWVGIGPLLSDEVVERLASDLDAAIDDPSDERLMAVEITITTNIVSALGLSIQFSDADGDG